MAIGALAGAVPLALAQEGARACIAARNQTLLDEVVSEIDAIGGEGHAVDLTTLEGCQKVVDEAVGTFGGVEILVNCVSAAQGGDVLTLSTDLIDEALSLKSYSYLRLSQLVIPHIRQIGWGWIIHIAGGAGTNPGQRAPLLSPALRGLFPIVRMVALP